MSEISKHIGYKEATFSVTASKLGIDNTPSPAHLHNMVILAERVFEPLRAHVGGPIRITSFYRSLALNKVVGGSSNSQHCVGEAMDLDMDMVHGAKATNAELFNYIRNHLQFDQLIWEFGTNTHPEWVHVSLKRTGPNRMQALSAVRSTSGRITYQVYAP